MAYKSGSSRDLTTQVRFKDGAELLTLAAAATFTRKTANILNVDPGGSARDITLPAEAESNGLFFFIKNVADAKESLTIKNDAPATVVVLAQGQSALVFCDGTTWRYQRLGSSLGANTETLAANKTLIVSDPVHQRLDPGGSARDVTLPAEADSLDLRFEILNTADAAEDLTVKNDGGGTIVTISQNEKATVVFDGTDWVHMGIATIALS